MDAGVVEGLKEQTNVALTCQKQRWEILQLKQGVWYMTRGRWGFLLRVLCDAVQFLNHLAGFTSFDAIGWKSSLFIVLQMVILKISFFSSCRCGRSLVAWRGGGRAWSLVLTQTDPNSRRPILTYRAIHKTQCYTTAEDVCCCNLKEISHVITLMEQNCCWMFKYSADDSQRQPMKRCISQPLSLKKEICCNIRLSSRWVH